MIQWHSHLSPLISGGCMIIAGCWCYLLYRRLIAKMPRRRALQLLLPEAAVALLLVIALLEPTWVTEQKLDVKGRILALVDASSSMSVKDGDRSRKDRALAVLAKLKAGLAPEFTVEPLEFDTQIRAAPAAGGQRPTASGLRGTDLDGCLRTLAERPDISSYAGIVVLTDGGDEKADNLPAPAVPVSVVGVGVEAAKQSDVALAEVTFPSSIEKGVEYEIGAELRANAGNDPSFAAHLASVRVTLESEAASGWQKAAETNVNLSFKRALAKFKTTDPAPGIRHYRVAVAPVSGELSALNNTRAFAVEVQRQAIHVLYFTRELGMDFKILRNEIGRDPGIVFTALYRTLGERFTVQGQRLRGDAGLEAGFPAQAQILGLYDVVIIGSFPATEWMPPQMEALAAYVQKGGAAIFLGGDASFGWGGYAGTPLAPLMPWQIAAGEGELQRGTFPVNVSSLASSHPIVAGVDVLLAEDPEPVLESINRPGPLRVAATSLLEVRADHQTVPVMAIQPYGRGKVLGIASNSLWKWARKSKPLALAFMKIWRQAIRNLAGEGEGGRILAVTWNKERYRPGDDARAEIRVTGREAAAELQLRASLLCGAETTAIPVEPQQGAGDGYAASLPFKTRGDYVFKLTAYQKNILLEEYEKILRVGPLLDEGASLEVDEAYLQKLAGKTGGLYVRPENADELVARLKSGLMEQRLMVETPLVQKGPWFFVLVLALLLIEWIVRRRWFMV